MSISNLEEAPAPFFLPAAPESQAGPVKAWSESVLIPTYRPGPPDRNPMFVETRNFEGSSGRIYPLPAVDRVSKTSELHLWQAVHLENEFLRVMILPEIGGRIHVGIDKTNGYSFIARENVIEPALAGLIGPWVRGGVEFSWPRNPRLAAFSLTSTHIEEHADGSRTVWCSSHDPSTRMKGMHGMCLYPGRAYLELKVRLFNRTPYTQIGGWWTHMAVPASENYQLFFPADAHQQSGRPGAEVEILASSDDFFGGYDHDRKAGVVQIVDHQISPVKARHTLSRTDLELITPVYARSQQDASFFAPYETRTFSQFWYPIQKIGPVQKATVDGAVSLNVTNSRAVVGICVTRSFPGATIVLEHGANSLVRWSVDLTPGNPLLEAADVPDELEWRELSVKVIASQGREPIRLGPSAPPPARSMSVAEEPPPARKVSSVHELYLIGLHLEQIRHPRRHAEEYWREALRRDPADPLCNNALGLWHFHRGEFQKAETHFRRSIASLTNWSSSPSEGEPFYNLGLALRYQDRDTEAYDEFHKASLSFGWRAAALHAIAELDIKRKQPGLAPKHLYEALRLNADNNHSRSLAALLFRRFGRTKEAEHLLRETLGLDPLDTGARQLLEQVFSGNNQVRLDLAFDYGRAGLYDVAIELLSSADFTVRDGSVPIVYYALAYFYLQVADPMKAWDTYEAAVQAPPEYCFPHRLEELVILERAVAVKPEDARARYYLGNLFFDRARHEEAIALWEESARLDPSLATVWRNLGIGYFNIRKDNEKARDAFERAHNCDLADARIIFERDQLWKLLGVLPLQRVAELKKHHEAIQVQDDLALELACLYNTIGQSREALAILEGQSFQLWAGLEGAVLEQCRRAYLLLGRDAMETRDFSQAREMFASAAQCQGSLGKAEPGISSDSEVFFWIGENFAALGNATSARDYWTRSAAARSVGASVDGKTFSEASIYAALSLERLGERLPPRLLLREVLFYGRKLAGAKPDPGSKELSPAYFALSDPALLVFKEDLLKRTRIEGLSLQAYARYGLGQFKLARRLVYQVLASDPNHQRASDLLRDLPKPYSTARSLS